MSEKPPAFVVVDKRKFTAEGDIREGFVAPEPETPSTPAAPPEPEQFSSAKVVTMPARPLELAQADDLGEEEMAGSLGPLTDPRAGAGLLADSDGPETKSELGTLAGDLAAGFGEDFADGDPLSTPRSAAETAAQHAAYQQSSREIDSLLQQSNPGMQAPGTIGFEHLIQSFYLSAIMAMGAGTEPGQKPRVDILAARQSIDMLAVLEQKTRGNLSPQEQQLLQGITFELRMMFLELTNAISKQAHQPSPIPPGAGLR